MSQDFRRSSHGTHSRQQYFVIFEDLHSCCSKESVTNLDCFRMLRFRSVCCRINLCRRRGCSHSSSASFKDCLKIMLQKWLHYRGERGFCCSIFVAATPLRLTPTTPLFPNRFLSLSGAWYPIVARTGNELANQPRANCLSLVAKALYHGKHETVARLCSKVYRYLLC